MLAGSMVCQLGLPDIGEQAGFSLDGTFGHVGLQDGSEQVSQDH